MATAINAQGTVITYEDQQATPVAQVVGGAISYSGFDGEATEIDITTLASTAKEFRLGLVDQGTFGIELNFDPADIGQATLEAAQVAGTTAQMVITLVGGATATFNALVKGFSKSGGVDDVWKASVTMRITGAVTWA